MDTNKDTKDQTASPQEVAGAPAPRESSPAPFLPMDADGIDAMFGATKVAKMLPKYLEIPQEFRNSRTPQNHLFSQWFFGGMKSIDFLHAKPGIDRQRALGHIASCMRSWDPKHEHKEAGCAYLFSLWFEPFTRADVDKNVKPAQKGA